MPIAAPVLRAIMAMTKPSTPLPAVTAETLRPSSIVDSTNARSTPFVRATRRGNKSEDETERRQ
jgi:hypothetical protein